MLKEHKKLYKAGKNWLTATITVTALTLMGVNAHADSNNTSDDSSTQVSSTSNAKEQAIQQTAVNISTNSSQDEKENSSVNNSSSVAAQVSVNVSQTKTIPVNVSKNEQQNVDSSVNDSSNELDPNIYGTVNVKDWDYQDSNNIINLTGYHGQDTQHIVVPNLNDFNNAGVNIESATGIGITSTLTRDLVSRSLTFAISKTSGNYSNKVIATDSNWFETFASTGLINADLSNLDTKNIINMGGMFCKNEKLKTIGDLSDWNTGNVTDMGAMFYSTNINNIGNISRWNTNKVTNMANMFGRVAIRDMGDLGKWNISHVKYIDSMFYESLQLVSVGDLSKWDTSNVTDMSQMFEGTPNLKSVGDLSKWDTSNVTDMSQMFDGTNLKSVGDLSKWNTSKVTNMAGMFDGGFESIGDISNWDTSNVTDMAYMFRNTQNLKRIGDLSGWDTSKVIDMAGMFDQAKSLESIGDISKWNTNKTTNMYDMFSNSKLPFFYVSTSENWIIPNKATLKDNKGKVIETINTPTIYRYSKDNSKSSIRSVVYSLVKNEVDRLNNSKNIRYENLTLDPRQGIMYPEREANAIYIVNVIRIGIINYVDQNTIVKSDKIYGEAGENVKVNIALPDGYELANKDEQLPTTVPVTENGIQTVTVNVKKTPITKTGSINYVDPTGKLLKTDTVSGKIGDNVKISINLPDGYELANKDEQLPSTVLVTENGIQTVIVNVKKIPITVSGHINYIDEDGKVIKTDTVSGVVGTSIPVKIVIPDGYELANKDEQLPTTIKIDNDQLQDLTIKVKKIASPSQSADNQVPQDHTTQNNQLNFNQGWLDNYGLTQTKDGQSQIKASGWHVAGQSNQDSYRYMIVYDNTLGHEVARQKLTPVVRNDVRRAYSNVNNSNYSGFDMTIDIPTSTINHSLSLVARYSNDAVNGEGQHVDYWFGPLKMDDSNQGYLDSIKSDGKTVTVSGWHATNQAANRPYHYIIAFDQTLGHEIARQKVESVQRPDVAKVYGKIANAINSGYSTKFNLTSQYFNDNIQFLSRWTDDPNGNGNSVDYWFNPVNRINRANLDSVDLSSGELKVAGWHATDMSEFEPNHFLIVFDNTTGQQVASQKVELESSVDVAKVYSDTRTANHSRFNFNFGALNLQPGHNYSLVSRYSTDGNGNGNDGAHTDSWLNMGIFSQKAHNLDSTVLNGNTLTFQGWMADDQATIKQYPYAILLQNGKEIARQQLDLTTRPDVAKVYPRLYQSKKSGFNASFKLPTVSLDNLQLVLRYTDSKDGNGNPSDTWININHGMIKKI